MPIVERVREDVDQLDLQEAPLDRTVLLEGIHLLLERAEGPLPLLDLLLMVALADHLHLSKVGAPISGDDYLSSPTGLTPIHLFSELLAARETGVPWEGGVTVAQDFFAHLASRSKLHRLSRGVRSSLNQAYEMVSGRSFGQVTESMNETCPEWLSTVGHLVTLADALVAFEANRNEAEEWSKELRLNL